MHEWFDRDQRQKYSEAEERLFMALWHFQLKTTLIDIKTLRELQLEKVILDGDLAEKQC